ncbi:hypothetical protein COCNU_03G015720 [Cocos nucifera]|uniref:Uncharacterized protein n=1 Tax=Cocos nucifera TaxID=13894 RepID=A0A8K0I482_COCNU|nr:hypothetical protein COCNU_03G015720 [Cocos nucifera]
MDDTWRLLPVQGHLCPVCSTPYFPFCSPPSAFHRNRYASEHLRCFPPDVHPPFSQDPRFPRPLYDPPFRDSRAAPPMPFRMPGARGAEPWGRIPHPGYLLRSGFIQEEFLERENSRERMRVEELAMGNLPPPPRPYNRFGHDAMQNQYQSVGSDHGGYVGWNGPMLPRGPVFSLSASKCIRGILEFLMASTGLYLLKGRILKEGKYYPNDHQRINLAEKSFHGYPKHPQYSEMVPKDVHKPFEPETFTSVVQAGPGGGKQGGYLPLPAKSNSDVMAEEMLVLVYQPLFFRKGVVPFQDSNPLIDEEDAVGITVQSNITESKRRFCEQLHAERESFKAVFDRRGQCTRGLYDVEDE